MEEYPDFFTETIRKDLKMDDIEKFVRPHPPTINSID